MVLNQELAKFPNRPINVPERFKGFHSSIKPEDGTWELRFPIRGNDQTASISIYPAACMNGEQVEAYAFPKRFTITAFPANNGPAITVADWSHADFPQQGLSPIIFPFTSDPYNEIRMTVHEGAPMPDGGYAFALSEVSFRHFGIEQIPLEAAPEDRLDILPYWSAVYATDGQTVFGSPAPASVASNGTFRTVPKKTDAAQLTIQLPTAKMWNSLEFHPSQNVNGLPPEDFPREFLVEFSRTKNFDKLVHTVRSSTKKESIPNGEYPFVLRFPPVLARSVRITFNPSLPNEPLQLEEVTFNGGHLFQLQEWYKKKDISGSPGTTALYDRLINGHWNYPPIRRAVNLIRRDILLEELHRVKVASESIRRTHERTLTWLIATAVTLPSLLLCMFIIYQLRQVKKMHHRTCHRIQQDLHDEIGSQLSAISLISNFTKNAPNLDPELRPELADINQSARVATASLAEVIWVTDKDILPLDQCLDLMKNRAEKMVHTMHLEVDFPRKVPPLELSYKSKRNLILLFTEALNNALKHSNADTISVSARVNDQRQLTLSIHDNGQGFSPDAESAGIGLESMKDRARKLGGKLDITSSPDQGTTVTLQGKLPPQHHFIQRRGATC